MNPEVEHVEADGRAVLAARVRARIGIVHLVAVEESAEHPDVLLELGVADGALAHEALRGVAGPDPEEDPPRREAVDGRDAVGGDRSASSARDAHPGPQPDGAGLSGGEGQEGVAVGPDHLAVRDPEVGIAQVLGLDGEADVVDLGDRANAEIHVLPLPGARSDGQAFSLYNLSNTPEVNLACRSMLRRVPTATSRWRGTIAVRTPSSVFLANLTWLPF